MTGTALLWVLDEQESEPECSPNRAESLTFFQERGVVFLG